MSFFNGAKMETRTRYYVIDPIDGVILTSTRDYRVAQAVAQGILDASVESLHDTSKNKNAIKWSTENWEKFDFDHVKFSDPDNLVIVDPGTLSKRYFRDKPVSVTRKRYFTFLFVLADNILYSYLNDNLVSPEVLTAMQAALADDMLLEDYAAIMNLNLEEARKEVELKVKNRNYALVRLQARVERLVDTANKETDIQKIIDLYEVTRAQLIGVTT